MEYNHKEIEKKWQLYWKENKTYKVDVNKDKPKYYVLDMFPYPSGAGLHVGHPLGYIASDIYSRYKRLCGFNVLHPMGYDAYGLPAEQYAIQTGQHPEVTTVNNINRYREQLDKIGFCYDWSREIRTCDPDYYKWTQWTFMKMFNSYYDLKENKACCIDKLTEHFEKYGTDGVQAASNENLKFTAEEWNKMSEKEKSDVLMNYRIAYRGKTMVNWCPKLGTVLANDEVSEGVSIRGGYPVEQKIMNQWCLRVSAYAQRLLEGLDKIDWTDSLKETQKNWIGRSEGAEMKFKVDGKDLNLEIFTTRADTVFGVTFMVLAPESEYVEMVVSDDQKENVNKYLEEVKHKTERERLIDKQVTGVFSGSYAVNPLTGKNVPIWISDYVLAGYGTGAIMAVPAHDSRDYAFARKFDLPIIPLIEGCDVSKESFDAKEGKMINSSNGELNLNGLEVKEAIAATKKYIEEKGIGKVKVNYRLRDAIFSRQRYWGAPIPIIHCPHCGNVPVPEKDLPVLLPDIDDYLPSGDGQSPLAKVDSWVNTTCPNCGAAAKRETDTMDGYACSSWYLWRYTDARNDKEAWDPAKVNYWCPLDFYVGGDHAVAHLLYVRFWAKFFASKGKLAFTEPIKRLLYNGYINAPDGRKMSKSKGNVIDPLDVIDSGYGADTLRTYEMFIGPYDLDAAWSTGGIGGVYRFLNRCWTLAQEYIDSDKIAKLSDQTKADLLRTRHATIKKVTSDLFDAQFNTAVSALMEYLNSLTKLKAEGFNSELWGGALSDLCQMLAPFAPHIANEMYCQLNGDDKRLDDIEWPKYDEQYLVTSTIKIAVQVNGKLRGEIETSVDADKETIIEQALAQPNVVRFTDGKEIVKQIYVPGKILNLVVK